MARVRVLSQPNMKWTGVTNSIANFRGTGHRIGNKAKQRTKQAKAAALQAPNTRSRSHLLTNARRQCQYRSALNRRQVEEKKDGRLHDLMHVTITATEELWSYHKRFALASKRRHQDLQAKKPSSSSLLFGAGNGAPGPSLWVGSRT